MSDKKNSYSTEEIEKIYQLASEKKSIEDISHLMNRTQNSIRYFFREHGLEYKMTHKLEDEELLYGDCAYSFWEKTFGYDIDVHQSQYGYTRSNMKNAMPVGALSPREAWENGGKQRFEAIKKSRRDMKAARGNSTAPIEGWLKEFVKSERIL